MTVHCTSESGALKARPSVGSATLTMCMSIAVMKIPVT
jgi:hypothetical protein